MKPSSRSAAPSSLPDLCSAGSLLVHLLLGSLIALMLTLGGDAWLGDFWLDFGLTLLFVEWLVLISVFLICRAERWGLFSSAVRLVLLIPAIAVLVTLLSTLLLSAGGLFVSDLPPGWLLVRNGVLAALLAFAFARYVVLQTSWRRSVAADARARLDALQSRIHPHFLFNALNTVSELVHQDPTRAEDALLDLSDLLRSGLRNESEHSLAEELRLIRSYLRLEALRLGDRLQVDWQVDDAIDQSQIRPALLIQPLVENAILHGIAPKPEGGVLKIRFELVRFGRIRVVIENPLPTEPRASRGGNGTALENIRQRLALAFDEGAQLKAERVGECFRAVLTLPAGRKPE
jgi:two-component system sensor histidine kinase AlgZ